MLHYHIDAETKWPQFRRRYFQLYLQNVLIFWSKWFVPKSPINNMPAMVRIMAWCRKAPSHYLHHWWSYIRAHISAIQHRHILELCYILPVYTVPSIPVHMYACIGHHRESLIGGFHLTHGSYVISPRRLHQVLCRLRTVKLITGRVEYELNWSPTNISLPVLSYHQNIGLYTVKQMVNDYHLTATFEHPLITFNIFVNTFVIVRKCVAYN